MPGTHLGEQVGTWVGSRCTTASLVVERYIRRQSYKHVIKDYKKCTERKYFR